jgi:hypothetical protein
MRPTAGSEVHFFIRVDDLYCINVPPEYLPKTGEQGTGYSLPKRHD